MSFKLQNVCETIIVEGCYGLKCVLPNSYVEALTHQCFRMSEFGDRTFTVVIKVK